MPIEIRELIIKATVSGEKSNTSANGVGGKRSESSINEIVDKVLEIIKEKNER
jgi:hypothetical protein